MSLEELGKPRLGNAKVLSFEGPPNLFAVGIRSGIVAPGPLMPNEIRETSFFPTFAQLFSTVSWLHSRTGKTNPLFVVAFTYDQRP